MKISALRFTSRFASSFASSLAASFATAMFVASFLPTQAEAHPYHTPNVCSTTAPEVCAHLGFKAEPSASSVQEFMLHFMPESSVDVKEIANVTVSLWMEMGPDSHGSSPVTITQGNDVHYMVKDVYFLMPGIWQVKIGFEYKGTAHQIVIPVEAK